jgi:arylsulfatase A-like enzyme
VFRNAFASASWTLPAHASLFTGLYPDRHGLVTPGKRLAEDQETLASLLQRQGFETVAFTGGGFLSGAYGFGKGFERYDGWTARGERRPQLRLLHSGAEDGELFDRAIAYLGAGGSDRRFFLFLHTYFVHDYYKEETEELKACVLGQKACGAEVWEDLKKRYRDRVAAFDGGFGRLLSALEEGSLAESTLLIVLSDHGEGFEPERNRIHHGGRLHEDVLRIPLLVGGPRLAPRFVDRSVSLVDVAPTIAELLDLALRGVPDGVSVAKDLYGDETPSAPRTLFAMEHAYRWVDGARVDFRAPAKGPPANAVIHRNLHYVRGDLGEEIYDLRADPGERRDLARSSVDLSPFRKALEARANFEPGGEVMTMDKELEDQLRSLGYIK